MVVEELASDGVGCVDDEDDVAALLGGIAVAEAHVSRAAYVG